MGFLSVLLAGGVVFNLYEKNSRSLAPALFLSITEIPPGTFAGNPNKNLNPIFAPVDLNRAGVDDLERLPGLGPALAERILRYREEKGNYKTVHELLRVPGIGPRKLAQIQSKVYVSRGAVQTLGGSFNERTPQAFPSRSSTISRESSLVSPQAERP